MIITSSCLDRDNQLINQQEEEEEARVSSSPEKCLHVVKFAVRL